jgi:hypothetical protein
MSPRSTAGPVFLPVLEGQYLAEGPLWQGCDTKVALGDQMHGAAAFALPLRNLLVIQASGRL